MRQFSNKLWGKKNARRVINLHQKGYALDFQLIFPNELICLQEAIRFKLHHVDIRVIDQLFDGDSGEYKYIHSVDTCCGYRGLILSNKIITRLGVS